MSVVLVISTMQVLEFNLLEWFSKRGSILSALFARSFALTRGTGYTIFFFTSTTGAIVLYYVRNVGQRRLC